MPAVAAELAQEQSVFQRQVDAVLENLAFPLGRQARPVWFPSAPAEDWGAVMDPLHPPPRPLILQLVPLHQHKLTAGSSGHQEVAEEASWDGQAVQGGGPSSLKSPPAQTVHV